MKRLAERDMTPFWLTGAMVLMWALLHYLTGTNALGSTYYNTYTLQALAWRDGRVALPYDFPALELAIYNNLYYVSFPPVPSVPLYLLSFIFSASTPDNLLVKLYALAACLMLYSALKRAGHSQLSAALYAFLGAFASSLLPMTLNGAVWYHAQVLGFALTVASLFFMTRDQMTASLACYALAVGCRPMNALFGIALMLIYLAINRRYGTPFKEILRRMLPGIIIGLLIAAAYGAYNYIRFGNPLECGHNHLPEFSFQGGIQFSLNHLAKNIQTFLFGAPIELENGVVYFKKFGYSMFIACPILTLMLLWAVIDIIKKRFTLEKGIVLFFFAAQLFLLLLHRTFGGFQLGARYCADLIPYAFFYLLLSPKRKRIPVAETLILGLLFVFTCFGIMQVHL